MNCLAVLAADRNKTLNYYGLSKDRRGVFSALTAANEKTYGAGAMPMVIVRNCSKAVSVKFAVPLPPLAD